MAGKTKPIGLNFETVGSIAAIVIGACALFVAWDQAQIMRKQQHASVIPAVSIASGFSSDAESFVMTVTVNNDGIGPARIESAALYVDGAPVRDWPDLRDRFLPPALHQGFQSNLTSAIGLLAAGAQSTAIQFSWPRNEQNRIGFEALKARAFTADANKNYMTVCYCSVFDKCWITGSERNSARPTKVKKCNDAGDDVVARLLQSISEDEEQ